MINFFKYLSGSNKKQDNDLTSTINDKIELNTEPKIELNTEPNIDSKIELNTEPNIDSKIELNTEPNIDSKIELNTEPIIELNKESSTSSLLKNGCVFDLGMIKLLDLNMEKTNIFKGAHTWLKNIFKIKRDSDSGKKIKIIIDEKSINILPDSIISDKIDVTHGGLMDYVFNAWAKELGVVLTPDMFFYTIISELKDYIVSNPKEFQEMFTNSEDKQTINIVCLTIDKLIDVLEKLIPSKELFKIINESNFSTQPNHFKQVLGITFADMATPYYDYSTTRCGIPRVIVLGEQTEWNNLYLTIRELCSILEPHSKVMKLYLNRTIETIFELIQAVSNNDIDFFEKMFIYGDDPHKCLSGHDDVFVKGWLRNLYVGYFYNNKHYGWPNLIRKFPSHLNVLPYFDKDNKKYCVYMCGLSSSKIINDYLFPEYNIAHCEIIHPNKEIIFNTISKKQEKNKTN